jgi:serine/threonine protein kinase
MYPQMIGGKLLGEGAKGFVQDNQYTDKDPHTFHNYIKNVLDDISELTLYHSPSVTSRINKDDDVRHTLLEILKNTAVVVKTFKGDNPKNHFLNELKANERIINLFPDARYHTIRHVVQYNSTAVYAIEISYKSNSRVKNNTYHIFSEGCSIQVLDFKFTRQSFDKFVREVKVILDTIHSIDFYHNDIKPTNVIYCNKSNAFKVIDWELAETLPKRPYLWSETGSKFFCHPLKLYIAGTPNAIARRMMTFYVMYGKETWVKNLKAFGVIKSLAGASFDNILKKYNKLTTRQLQAKFGPYFDNWAFAVTIILLAEKNGVEAPKDVIDELLQPFMVTY